MTELTSWLLMLLSSVTLGELLNLSVLRRYHLASVEDDDFHLLGSLRGEGMMFPQCFAQYVTIINNENNDVPQPGGQTLPETVTEVIGYRTPPLFA